MASPEASKAMTLRLPKRRASELEAVARADGITVSDAMRVAVDAHIEARKQDPAFRERIQKLVEDEREVLMRLVE